ncbi:hypothetical protein [Parashewanella tropica]|uniref:hypothetical protein n=1 Tax=Parashewanella tropica TaxID=2547970 RepID=UPI001478134F|nr:hypothetical protein [Parashewanella tropica]
MNIRSKSLSILCACFAVGGSAASAATIPVHVQCNVSAHTAMAATLTLPKNLGFFFVNSDVSPSDIQALYVSGTKKDSYFSFEGLQNNKNFTVTYNQLVTDQQSNQPVRRYKLKFGSPQQDSNFSHVFINKNLLNSANNLVQIDGRVEYCLDHPDFKEDLNAQITLQVPYDYDGDQILDYWEVSKPGVQVTDDAIPVDFKGGNGSPLSIYIEAGVTETGINYHKALQGDSPFDSIDLTLIPNDNKSLLPDSSVRQGFIDLLPTYSKNIDIRDVPLGSAMSEIDAHAINIQTAYLNNSTANETDFNSLPSVLRVVDNTFYLNHYNAPPPTPGWYIPDVTVEKFNDSVGGDTFKSVKSFTDVPPVISRNDSIVSNQISKLIELGSAFQNQVLDFDVFKQERFYIVNSVDSEGRVKLARIRSGDSATNPICFDFSKLSNGDITWWGSRVRWLIKDENGNVKIQEGYFGWHAPDGNYAFLNLNDGVKSLSTLPKKGDVIAFEFAKVDQ